MKKSPVITYELAIHAGRAAGNRRMHKAGRTSWDDGDWDEACRVCDEMVEKIPPPDQREEERPKAA